MSSAHSGTAVFRLASFFARITTAVTASMVVFMALLIVVDVAARAFLNSPLPGTSDLVAYWLMPAIAMLPLGVAELSNEHIRVTMVTEAAAAASVRFTELATQILVLPLIVWVAYQCCLELLESIRIGEAAPANPWLLLWPGRLVIVAGLAILIVCAIARLVVLLMPPSSAADATGHGRAE